MLEEAKKAMSERFIDDMKKMHPGAFAQTEDIANIAEFLISDNSKSITGKIIEAGEFNINIPSL